MWIVFSNAKATHIFTAKILAYMPYLIIKSFMLTNDAVGFEQLGPECNIKGPNNWLLKVASFAKMTENINQMYPVLFTIMSVVWWWVY